MRATPSRARAPASRSSGRRAARSPTPTGDSSSRAVPAGERDDPRAPARLQDARAGASSCAPATRRASSCGSRPKPRCSAPCEPRRGPSSATLFDSRPSVGTVQITARAAEGVPKFGEPDIIRIVQLLPGVEARNDFSTGFNVRGGESDQNLILARRLSDLQSVSPRRLVQHVHRSDGARRHADDGRISRALRRPAVERCSTSIRPKKCAPACTARPSCRCLSSTGELGGVVRPRESARG